jgi:isochorismate hydrolase
MASKLDRWKQFVSAEEIEAYKKGDFASRIGLGRRPALLSIDTTFMFVDAAYPLCAGPMEPLRAAVTEITELFRSLDLPIYYSRRDDRSQPVRRGVWNLKRGTAKSPAYTKDPKADEWPEEYAPRPQDTIILKNKPSCFFATPLESFLRYDDVDSLVIVGVSTSGCVRAAACDAFSHNFRVVVVEEAVGDRSPSAHLANLFDMDMKYADVESLADVRKSLLASHKRAA